MTCWAEATAAKLHRLSRAAITGDFKRDNGAELFMISYLWGSACMKSEIPRYLRRLFQWTLTGQPPEQRAKKTAAPRGRLFDKRKGSDDSEPERVSFTSCACE